MIKNKIRFLSSRFFIVLVSFALMFLVVGSMLFYRMDTLLEEYTENQAKQRAETFSELASEQINTELENLSYIASRIEEEPDDIKRLMPTIYRANETIRQGLLTIDGGAVYGNSLSARDYPGILTSFRGKKAISFVEEKGLLFSCPVFHGTNIRYVLYRLFPMSSLEKIFSINCYDNLGKMLVTTRNGQIIIPFERSNQEDLAFYQSKKIQKAFLSMHREMEISVAVAKSFSTERGNMILFEAEVPDTDFLVAGFVPSKVASEGIGNILFLMVLVFGLLMLLVLLGGIYVASAFVKVRESDELRRAKAAAEEASKAKSNFLANMSHEIRTPINVVLGMDEIILRETAEEKTRQHAINIQRAGNILLSLINDVLDFSKIEAGKMELVPTEYDFAVMVADLVDMIRPRMEGKGLHFFIEIDQRIPRYLYGDSVLFKQCIMNILTNAVKYTKQGGVHFSIALKKQEEDKVKLYVCVEDTGIGIKKEDIQRLFTAFERIDEKKNRTVEGTGLGMNIVQQILDLLGSHLEVRSEYGRGSTFAFAIEQKVMGKEIIGDFEAAARIVAEKESYYKESFTAPDAGILIVDDSEMNLEVVKGLLLKTHILTDTAVSGLEALDKMKEKTYDLLFFDHMMPGMDGIELLHHLKVMDGNPNAEKPCIVLTANAVSGAKEEYLTEGFDDYMSKPINGKTLERILIKYLPKEKIHFVDTENVEGQNDSGTKGHVEYPDLEGIDVSYGIENSGSDEAYKQVLQLFYENIQPEAKELDRLFVLEDWSGYTVKVHAVKSSGRIIGARAFGEVAQELEDAGKAGNIDYIREHHEAFVSEYRHFAEVLEDSCKKKEKQRGREEA